MLSLTSEYALRTTVYLAGQYGRWTGRAEIAKVTRVPADYLLKVLNCLVEAGVVESRRGPGGGYSLTELPEKTTVLRVVETVEEIPGIMACPLGLPGHEQLCPLHRLLDQGARAFRQSLKRVSLNDLVAGPQNGSSCVFPAKEGARRR
jgi:Rrf2 family protein